MKIEPLSKETLKEASSLTLKIFKTNKKELDYPPKWLKLSLNLKEHQKEINYLNLTKLKYWVAIENETVIGIVGYYTLKTDPLSGWLGWYCVEPKVRGKGIGKKLLDFIIKKAKEENKDFLRLYTSTDENEKVANQLYNNIGFKLMTKEKVINAITREIFEKFGEDMLYKELELRPIYD